MHSTETRILMVEDNEDDYEIARAQLAGVVGHKYSLHWARTVEEGLAALAEASYDVCLVDYTLGTGSGIDLILAMASESLGPPAILLTGYGDPAIDLKAMRAGAANFLHKQDVTTLLFERTIRYVVEHHRAKQELQRVNVALSEEIIRRKLAEEDQRDLHARLVESSRLAGMAEIATDVLHNVGNVLNSVNVSTNLLKEKLKHSRIETLVKVSQVISNHEAEWRSFLMEDERGRELPRLLRELATHLVDERDTQFAELHSLSECVEHIKAIVAMQQQVAQVRGDKVPTDLVSLIEDGLSIGFAGLARHGVTVMREFHESPTIVTVPHKVLQILVHLIGNAKDGLSQINRNDKMITLTVTMDSHEARIEVRDNGIGVPADKLTKIFSHGFTTRKDGHGFGLHSCAITAQELGGALTVHSEGSGHGAAFTLHLPLPAE